MIITDRFVFIHQPKTGGTFVREALLRAHGFASEDGSRLESGDNPNRVGEGPYGPLSLDSHIHARCRDIPEPHRGKRVLAAIRNPYDWYVSHYTFGWWKGPKRVRQFRRTIPDLDDRYPSFPEVSFADFVDFTNRAYPVFPELGFGGSRELSSILHPDLEGPLPRGADGIGAMTQEFVDFYFGDPACALSRLDEAYISSGSYRADMFDVHFVRTDRLNHELQDFLVGEGYQAEDVSFISDLERIHPHGVGRASHETWETYYTPELKQFVRRQERHLFLLFPEFDV